MITLHIQISTFSLVQIVAIVVTLATAALSFYTGAVLYANSDNSDVRLRALCLSTGAIQTVQVTCLLCTAMLLISGRLRLILANGTPQLISGLLGMLWFCMVLARPSHSHDSSNGTNSSSYTNSRSKILEPACFVMWVFAQTANAMALIFSVMDLQLLESRHRESAAYAYAGMRSTHIAHDSFGQSSTLYEKPDNLYSHNHTNSAALTYTSSEAYSPRSVTTRSPLFRSLKPAFRAHHQRDSDVDQADHTMLSKLFNLKPSNGLNINANSKTKNEQTFPITIADMASVQDFDDWDFNAASLRGKYFLPSPIPSPSPTPASITRATATPSGLASASMPESSAASVYTASANNFNRLLNHAGFARAYTPALIPQAGADPDPDTFIDTDALPVPRSRLLESYLAHSEGSEQRISEQRMSFGQFDKEQSLRASIDAA